VDEFAETKLAQRISMTGGYPRCKYFGRQKYAVRVQLNPDLLAAHGLGIDDVQRAIQQSNVNLPTGKLFGAKQAFTLQSRGQLTSAAAYRPITVAWRNGSPV
jgi:HAE1 family hydrophobic/amphiphilic exporter-1